MTEVENDMFFGVYSFLEYCLHLYGNFAKQPFYDYMYNKEEYYDIKISIVIRNVHMSLNILKTSMAGH